MSWIRTTLRSSIVHRPSSGTIDDRRWTTLERLDLDAPEFDVLSGALQSDRSRLELCVVRVEHFLAVEHHNEMVALCGHVKSMPLPHDHGRLVLALQVRVACLPP